MNGDPVPLPEDNRIVGPGITREFEYDGDTDTATFFVGGEELVIPMPFRSAQQLADALKRRYQEGYRAGLAKARQQIQSLERYA